MSGDRIEASENMLTRLRFVAEGDGTMITRADRRAIAWALNALEAARVERDEARALKVPPSVDELLDAKMDAATARTQRDVANTALEAADALAEYVPQVANGDPRDLFTLIVHLEDLADAYRKERAK